MNLTIPQLKVVLISFIDTSGRIMLNRRSDAQSEMWELVGGGVEVGETSMDAIQREIHEELGYRPTPERDALTLVKEFPYQNDKFSAQVSCFTANFPGFDVFSDSDEVSVGDLALYSREDALSLVLLPMTRLFLED